jgi:hypothetical protein
MGGVGVGGVRSENDKAKAIFGLVTVLLLGPTQEPHNWGGGGSIPCVTD